MRSVARCSHDTVAVSRSHISRLRITSAPAVPRLPSARYAKPAGFNLPWHKKPAAPASAPTSSPSSSDPSPPSAPKLKPVGGLNLWHLKPAAGGQGSQPPPPPPPPSASPLPEPLPDEGSLFAPSGLQSEVKLHATRKSDQVFAYKIIGHETQVVSVDLAPGDVVRASTGALLTMSPGIEMETKTDGFGKAVTRMVTGESFFISDFRNTTKLPATAIFGAAYPSKVLPLVLADRNRELICQRGAFLVGAPSTEISTWFTRKLATGFFGGEGFILQRLTGDGLVLLKGGGATVVKQLAEGEVLKTTPGSLIAMDASVGFEVEIVAGFKNFFFGQGLFLSKMTGPGTVWLQGLPFDRIADSVLYSMPR